jgi:hypothetical protein
MDDQQPKPRMIRAAWFCFDVKPAGGLKAI